MLQQLSRHLWRTGIDMLGVTIPFVMLVGVPGAVRHELFGFLGLVAADTQHLRVNAVPQNRLEIAGGYLRRQFRRFDPPITGTAARACPDVIDLKKLATIADKRARFADVMRAKVRELVPPPAPHLVGVPGQVILFSAGVKFVPGHYY
jgi:hypothetical protein